MAAGWVAALIAAGCAQPSPTPEPTVSLRAAEAAFEEALDWRDRRAVTMAKGEQRDDEGVALSELNRRFDETRSRVRTLLDRVPQDALDPEDRRAASVMDEILSRWDDRPTGNDDAADLACGDPRILGLEGEAGYQRLRSILYRCFGRVNETLSLDGEPVDRLTLLGRLASLQDAKQRRRAFYALEPFWEAVNGDNRPDSPYRLLVRLGAKSLKRSGTTLEAEAAGPLGLQASEVQRWLLGILEAWGSGLASPQPIEPWDVWSQGGAAAARLDARIPLATLRAVNDAFYRSLGADPEILGLRYDLAPRSGKTPVAFTDFGRRNRLRQGQWEQGRFWIFATYREGGLGNLFELLHESGHGVHIASIKTRPAFRDWPDSDVFTEGLADLAALEAYEPAWQEAFLGESIPIRESIRSKYASIALDAAWGLFELRLHRDPTLDPNQVWTEITNRYLHVRPHPEISWWALRGQLVESPGYMLNYGVGAVLIADIRARARQKWGPFADNPAWFGKAAEELFRFGRERPSALLLRDFLGRQPTPEAILADMRRGAR